MTRKNILLSLIAALSALVALAYFSQFVPQQPNVYERSTLGGDFTLQSNQGPVSLSQFKGGPVLVYFGFTACPDICPTSLEVMRQMFMNLSEAERAQVNALFISVDPQRDTLEHLESYAQFFSPRIQGITGTQDEIDQVVRQYGAFYRFVELENSAMDYTVDHSSRIYLINADGALVDTVPHDANPDELTGKVRALLPKQS